MTDSARSGGENVRQLLTESLEKSWGPLRFPRPLEAAYREHHRQQWLTQTRGTMLIGIILYAAFGLLDAVLFPEQVSVLLRLRLGLAVPIALVIFGYTFFARRDVQIQLAYSALLTLGGLNMAALTLYLPEQKAHLYSAGIILIIAFAYIIATLRVWYATASALLISFGYLSVLIFMREADSDTVISTAANLASINLIGFYAGLVIEIYTRRDFARLTLTELDRRQLASENIALEDLSFLDHMTGIANRRALERFLSDAWERAARHSLPVSALMIDLDRFKRFNDTHGHQAGDECLHAVAQAASQLIREPADLVARYGGEEFVVVLTGTDAIAATSVAERVREVVEALDLPNPDGEEPLHITASVGVATLWPAAGGHPSQLIRAADQALYQAKREGRNRVQARTE